MNALLWTIMIWYVIIDILGTVARSHINFDSAILIGTIVRTALVIVYMTRYVLVV